MRRARRSICHDLVPEGRITLARLQMDAEAPVNSFNVFSRQLREPPARAVERMDRHLPRVRAQRDKAFNALHPDRRIASEKIARRFVRKTRLSFERPPVAAVRIVDQLL